MADYIRIAKAKAKEWLVKKKKCRNRAEKKALRLGLRDAVRYWRLSLADLSPEEAAKQKKACRAFLIRINTLPLIIAAAVTVIVIVALLIIFL